MELVRDYIYSTEKYYNGVETLRFLRFPTELEYLRGLTPQANWELNFSSTGRAFPVLNYIDSVSLECCRYLDNDALAACRMESLSLPRCVFLGDGVLQGCMYLKNLDIPLVESIGCMALSNTSLWFLRADSCEYIDSYALTNGCLREVYLPRLQRLTSFMLAIPSLRKAYLPCVQQVDADAFSNSGGHASAHQLEVLDLPMATRFARGALDGLTSLRVLKVPRLIKIATPVAIGCCLNELKEVHVSRRNAEDVKSALFERTVTGFGGCKPEIVEVY